MIKFNIRFYFTYLLIFLIYINIIYSYRYTEFLNDDDDDDDDDTNIQNQYLHEKFIKIINNKQEDIQVFESSGTTIDLGSGNETCKNVFIFQVFLTQLKHSVSVDFVSL